jgi:hypothetical protein
MLTKLDLLFFIKNDNCHAFKNIVDFMLRVAGCGFSGINICHDCYKTYNCNGA